MFPVTSNHVFTSAGLFGAKRKFDIHTGIDIYCEEGSKVKCITNGIVLEVIDFTGASASSPWWRETKAIAIQDHYGTVYVYGEVQPLVKAGDEVYYGDIIATSLTVLKKDKGINPPCMLHFEIWESNYQSNYTWHHDEPIPVGLVNPLKLFNFWVVKSPNGYKIQTHDGKYWKFFSSSIDCKSYCMSRSEFNNETYILVNSETENAYFLDTGKRLFQVENF